jgi:hypothetical protein
VVSVVLLMLLVLSNPIPVRFAPVPAHWVA